VPGKILLVEGSKGNGFAPVRASTQLRRRPVARPDSELYAALDLGTNNCRLLVASARHGGFDVVDAYSKIVRLGEGLASTGSLSTDAMRRTIEALRVCATKLVWHNVSRKRLVATEACRLAANGAGFISAVENETGLKLEIVDRETEARLAAAGAAPLMDERASSVVVFDIGGGSTEILWLNRLASGYAIEAWTSLPVGVVTLSERVGGGRNVSSSVYSEMRARVQQLLEPFANEVHVKKNGNIVPSHLLGTSGTVTTIAGVHLGLRRYDRTKVDGSWMSAVEVEGVTSKLLAMSYQQRVENGCIGRERADLVLAGCAIFEEVRAAFPAERVRVADRGLREGILAELIQSHTGQAL
jgi:exopolyphosphatase / guanosine-5'-triphosphate,3'-diphosphate pyrophosphatase